MQIAVDMVGEGLITQRGGDPARRARIARPAPAPALDPEAEAAACIAHGPRRLAGRGGWPGRVRRRHAAKWAARGEKVILVRKETTPDDIHGMDAAQGILTATGGMTSHAAVVARGMGKPCVSRRSAHCT